ncbi:ABC transporter substrate-binding protein [Pleomorphomonas sp. JP5]|uniref:ABC transporter substrate-binding protein n=1 Tax=Pleomorphomonas sp. JP5 TaxID=2942998 RepID=UPI002043FF9F|nr:ABC transporter substrate-binding protein [Pleomorphomonas sp. JP5]MCM5557014.1 ABC transporter substrate-binding protein [Pleomorphomonas sp. JP5]
MSFRACLTAVLATSALAAFLPSASLAAPRTELVLAIGGEPDDGYDPVLGWGRYGHPLFQSTLLTREADLSTSPDLATAWSLSDDRLTWTITIRDGVKFSDGTPLTAKDVAFTFTETAKSGGTVDLSVMESAVATDEHTVVIKLKRPWITFVENFYALGIVPAAEYGPGYARKPVGSGPYRMVSWTEGEQLIVEANPFYYGKMSPFKRLTFLFTGEDTSLAAASAGKADVVSVPATLADAMPHGFTTVVADTVDNRGIVFPMRRNEGEKDAGGYPIGNDVTADIAIRKAINLGLDRKALVDAVLLGHGTPAYGPADDLPWSNPEGRVSEDEGAAKALLDAAGWAPGADGVRVKDGLRAAFDVIYPSSDSVRQGLAVMLSEQMKPLGIAITPKGDTWEGIDRVKHSTPVLFGWGSHSPQEVYSLYQSGWAGIESYNAGYFENAAVDGHFEKAQAAESLEASYPFWRQAEWDGKTGFSARGDAGWAWMVNLDHVYFVRACIDVGQTQIEPHGHGWPITATIQNWRWICE